MHTLELRVASGAAAALDKLCELAFADDRERMAAVWLDRWSRTDAVPDLDSIGDGAVEVAVAVDAVVMEALSVRSRRLGFTAASLASAVVSEHGRHVGDSGQPLSEGLPEPRSCWCSYLTYHHRS